jgi:leucine dehydrogenase
VLGSSPARRLTSAPDYVINAGGIISVAREYNGGVTEAQVTSEISGIPGRLIEVFERARREGRATNAVADDMARERIGRGEARLVA